jgi:hypothetical protein
MATPRVFLCSGSDCRKPKKARSRLIEVLDGRAQVVSVGCQKVCHGPVIGMELDGRLEWFEELRGREARRALEAWLDDGSLDKALDRKRVKKRAGKRR